MELCVNSGECFPLFIYPSTQLVSISGTGNQFGSVINNCEKPYGIHVYIVAC